MLYTRSIRCLEAALRSPLLRNQHTLAAATSNARPRRSYLYVPSSSERMLRKSLQSPSDVIIYDLEDSVAPLEKASARDGLLAFLNARHETPLPDTERVAVRLNGIGTPFFEDDLRAAVQTPHISTLVLPKINSPEDLDLVSKLISHSSASWSSSGSGRTRKQPLRIVASIESAQALWNVGRIAEWKSRIEREAVLTTLLFAAEDYCADTSIIRTPSRLELLYTRSQISLAAKTFGLEAVDMVCVNYKDIDYLKDECEDGRRLGYNGKQAIHPSQVDIIHSTFVPTEKEIRRAAKIVAMMESSHKDKKGAFGLDMGDGKGMEMIDAPMLKQAENVIRIAKSAGLEIPNV